MLTRCTPPEHIFVFRALLEIEIEIENADSVHSAGTHPPFRALLEIEIEIEIARARHAPHQSDHAKKNYMKRGQNINTYTDIATTRPTRPRGPSW